MFTVNQISFIMKRPIVKMEVQETSTQNSKGKSRRSFIKLSGLAFAGSTMLMYSCSEDDDFNPGGEQPGPDPEPDPDPEVFDLGSGDLGILNYAYALEQLEAAFYTEVRAGGYYAGASDEEKTLMDDLYNHEVIHREFFRTAIAAATADTPEAMLPDLEVDFSSIDFDDRTTVLETAMLLEDTGVAAYNGAGDRLETELYLVLAGKIVSVEARHASAIRSLLNPESTDFAGDDVIDENGLDPATDPADIYGAVVDLGIIQTPFTANELPEPRTGA